MEAFFLKWDFKLFFIFYFTIQTTFYIIKINAYYLNPIFNSYLDTNFLNTNNACVSFNLNFKPDFKLCGTFRVNVPDGIYAVLSQLSCVKDLED